MGRVLGWGGFNEARSFFGNATPTQPSPIKGEGFCAAIHGL